MNPPFAEWTVDPAWPWSEPGLGVPALLGVAAVLAALTIWTYAGARGSSFRRVLAVLALRLGALLVACLVVLRPSFADRDKSVVPSKLLFLIDASTSMNISDELNGLSRWDNARRILAAPPVDALLKRLQRQQKVEIVYHQAAEDVAKFDPTGKALGKRTDFAQWRRSLMKAHGIEENLRGLVVLSDGTDNGAPEEPALWRGVPCPIHTFALGSPATALNQQDVVVTAILPDPPVVPVKNKLTVKARINLFGFENQSVTVHLFVNDKEVSTKQLPLTKTVDNEVVVGEFRPDAAGEIKVGVVVDKVGDEVNVLNNKMETFVTVTNEGVSVLWVEGKKRAWEPVTAIRALTGDKRFHKSVFYTERLHDEPAAGQEDWFNFKDRHYDVIVIGDISARRFSGGRPEVFAQIRDMVKEKGTGLLMLGGYETFANSDWQKYREIADMLPVQLVEVGQIDEKIRMIPTPAGLKYVLKLSEGDPLGVWKAEGNDEVFAKLDGMAKLGPLNPGAEVFAREEGGDQRPIMAARAFGAGRTLVFGGDTTWKAWRRSVEAIRAYERFWKQVMLWLAKREDAAGDIWVIPDVRRVAAGGNNPVGFTVGARGKGGLPVPNARFSVKVIGPTETTEVATSQQNGQERGFFYRTNEPGEYVIEVTAKDAKGVDLGPPGRSKFLVYAEDLEQLRPAADHEFLKKLAAAGGGTAYPGGEDKMVEFLEGLLAQPLLPTRARAETWPDWRRTPLSDSIGDQVVALWSSGLLACFVVFVTLLSLEWYLRRRWGMV